MRFFRRMRIIITGIEVGGRDFARRAAGKLRSTWHKPLTNRNKELLPVAQFCTASAHQSQAEQFPKGMFFGDGFHTLIIAQTGGDPSLGQTLHIENSNSIVGDAGKGSFPGVCPSNLKFSNNPLMAAQRPRR